MPAWQSRGVPDPHDIVRRASETSRSNEKPVPGSRRNAVTWPEASLRSGLYSHGRGDGDCAVMSPPLRDDETAEMSPWLERTEAHVCRLRDGKDGRCGWLEVQTWITQPHGPYRICNGTVAALGRAVVLLRGGLSKGHQADGVVKALPRPAGRLPGEE